jgi:ABC-type amino acid transport substrate-binding protein
MKSFLIKFAALAPLVLFFAVSGGCTGGEKNAAAAKNTSDAGTLRSEVIRKISGRVIGGIPNKARLGEIRKNGILRVALTPEEPPFQSLDPALKLPVGFNPALAAEIALILEVKTNLTILNGTAGSGGVPPDWGKKYDLLFLPEGAAGCPAKNSVPYFYAGPGGGWKTICAAGPGGQLTDAVREIMTYLNETGIFAQLYRTHVSP